MEGGVVGALVSAPPLRDRVELSRIGPYRGLAEVWGALLALRELGAEVDVAATTRRGLPVPRVTFGPLDGEVVVVLAGIHAMEWIGVETGLALVRRLLAAPSGRRVVVFPVLNPEGYAAVEADLVAGRRRFLRTNDAGVDLNRNWPTFWRTTRWPQRLLTFLGSAGPHALSEPEVAAVVAELDPVARQRRLLRAVSLHSFGRKLLVPYGGRWRRPLGADQVDGLADEVNARLPKPYHRTTPARWVPGLFAYGMELDHLHAQGADALLVECSAGGLELRDPSSWLHPFRWFNPPDPEVQAEELAAALAPFLG